MVDKREKVKYLLRILTNIDIQYIKTVRRMGYKANMFWLLYSLDNNEPMSQKKICEDWNMAKTTLNTIVKECEQSGYITFETIKGQRREKVIVLTEAGKKYTKQILNKVYKAEDEAFYAMKNGDELIKLAEEFHDNLKEAFNNHLKK